MQCCPVNTGLQVHLPDFGNLETHADALSH